MLPRFQHLLIPVDFTEKNRSSLDIAFDLAAQNQARVTLLHVIETIDHLTEEELEDFYGRLESKAALDLESLTQRFSEAGLDVEFKVWYRKRSRDIVRFASERNVDLIIMSSHAIDAEQPLRSWGSVSYQVTVLCQCPVLLVK